MLRTRTMRSGRDSPCAVLKITRLVTVFSRESGRWAVTRMFGSVTWASAGRAPARTARTVAVMTAIRRIVFLFVTRGRRVKFRSVSDH